MMTQWKEKQTAKIFITAQGEENEIGWNKWSHAGCVKSWVCRSVSVREWGGVQGREAKEVTRTGMYLKVSSYASLEGGDAANPLACDLREAETNTDADAIAIWYTESCSGGHSWFYNWLNQVFQYRRWRNWCSRVYFISNFLFFLLLLLLLLVKNVFLCCTTGCIKKKQRWLWQSLKELTLAKSSRTASGYSCTVGE